jgi:hypothetical protein
MAETFLLAELSFSVLTELLAFQIKAPLHQIKECGFAAAI